MNKKREIEMKDFKIGQKVFVIKKPFITLIQGYIIKKLETTKRWKVKFDFNEIYPMGFYDESRTLERIQDDNEVFGTFDEAYSRALKEFEREVIKINKEKQEFIDETKKRFNIEVKNE